MKRLFLIATALLALPGPAAALDLPDLLRRQQGVSWCSQDLGTRDGWRAVRYRDASHSCGDLSHSDFAVERDGFSWE
jgi:hypothetical protein